MKSVWLSGCYHFLKLNKFKFWDNIKRLRDKVEIFWLLNHMSFWDTVDLKLTDCKAKYIFILAAFVFSILAFYKDLLYGITVSASSVLHMFIHKSCLHISLRLFSNSTKKCTIRSHISLNIWTENYSTHFILKPQLCIHFHHHRNPPPQINRMCNLLWFCFSNYGLQ